MSQVDLGKFACDACNRQYPWKPDYAGRKVKCKCGSVMTAPTEAPVPVATAPADDDDLLGGLYDLAEQEQQAAKNHATVETGLRCPGCQSDLAVGSAVCPACNFNLKTGLKERAQRATAATGAKAGGGNPMLAYAGANKRGAAQAKADMANSLGGDALKELYIPAALVVVGLVAQAVLYMHTGGTWHSLSAVLPMIGIGLVANLILSFVAVAIAVSIFEVSFGAAPGPAALKLVVICLLPTAIAEFIGSLVGVGSAYTRHAVPAILMFPLIAGFFIWLFDMDWSDARYCTFAVWLVNKWAVILVIGLFLTGQSGFGRAGGAMRTPSSAVIKADEAAAEQTEAPNATEARVWLKDSGNRMYSGDTHDSSLTLVTALYQAGCPKCTTLSDHGDGYALIAELPTSEAARKKAFALIQQHEAADKVPPEDQTTDQGQGYYTFEFSHKVLLR